MIVTSDRLQYQQIPLAQFDVGLYYLYCFVRSCNFYDDVSFLTLPSPCRLNSRVRRNEHNIKLKLACPPLTTRVADICHQRAAASLTLQSYGDTSSPYAVSRKPGIVRKLKNCLFYFVSAVTLQFKSGASLLCLKNCVF